MIMDSALGPNGHPKRTRTEHNPSAGPTGYGRVGAPIPG